MYSVDFPDSEKISLKRYVRKNEYIAPRRLRSEPAGISDDQSLSDPNKGSDEALTKDQTSNLNSPTFVGIPNDSDNSLRSNIECASEIQSGHTLSRERKKAIKRSHFQQQTSCYPAINSILCLISIIAFV